MLKYIYYAVCLMMLFAIPAAAYVDPSVMTYAIQVIAGVAIAVGAVAGILWRKAKKKVQKTLGIDENANKEVEEEIDFDDE